jgi:SAM-dependent methyltransferase
MVHFNAPATLSHWVQNKTGFEIGAPSIITWGSLGVYDAAATIDTTNFAGNTMWESGLKDGSPFLWKDQIKGKQYIRDAVNLHIIPNEFYDFVLASHVLEHIANPFKALLEWLRILRSGGLLLIITPSKNATFDHKRDTVLLEHLINDYHNQTTEADLSHLDEILRLHDLKMDLPAGNLQSFKVRSEKNFQNRGLHQHVYDQELLYYMFICLNMDVKIQNTWSNNDLIIGQKK